MWSAKISDKATVYDTIKLIRLTAANYSNSFFVKNLVKDLRKPGQSDQDFFKAAFNYACKNVIYKRDENGHEKITTPERLIKDGVGDCKKFTVLLAAILKAAGYKPFVKIISYDGVSFAHIYTIVPNEKGNGYTTLDPVNRCLYNQELKHVKHLTYPLVDMELSLLGNLPPTFGNKQGLSQEKLMQLRNVNKAILRRSMCDCTQSPYYWKNRKRAMQSNAFAPVAVLKGIDDLTYDVSAVSGEDVYINELSGAEYDATAFLGAMLSGYIDNDELTGIDDLDIGLQGTAEAKFLGCNSLHGEDTLEGIGRRRKRRTKAERKARRKRFFKRAWKSIKKVGASPGRNAYLLLVKLNAFKTAVKMHQAIQKNEGAVKDFWEKLGGNYSKLKQAVAKGYARYLKKQKGKGLKGLEDHTVGYLDTEQIEGLGAVTITAAAATAAPIIAATAIFLKKLGLFKGKEEEEAVMTEAADRAAADLEEGADSSSESEEPKKKYDGGGGDDDGGGGGVVNKIRRKVKEAMEDQEEEKEGGGGGGMKSYLPLAIGAAGLLYLATKK